MMVGTAASAATAAAAAAQLALGASRLERVSLAIPLFSRSDSSDPRRPGRETSRRGDVGRRRFRE